MATRRSICASAAVAALWLVSVGAGPAGALPIDPNSPTTDWMVVSYPNVSPDYFDDQQTGIGEADLVGDASHPAFYMEFDDAGTASTTDGFLAFRVRLGEDKPPPGYEHFLGVGLDADLDGDLDLFLGVDNSGNPDQLGIFAAGGGANTSPSTTTIISTPLQSYAPTASNYDFSAVDGTIDPTATSFDLDADGGTDYFLSFSISFDDIVTELAALGIAFDEDSPMRLVVGSSTQPNALNQDLGGPNGGTTSTQTWSQLGALSNVTSAASAPEPGTFGCVMLGLLWLAAHRPRAARKAASVSD